MGFMGLSHWSLSDEAADFRSALQKCKGNETKLKKRIKEEVYRTTNEYNTDGFINIALILEDEGNKSEKYFDDDTDESVTTPVISHLITQHQYQVLIDKFEIETYNGKLNNDLCRLLKVVKNKKV